MADNILLTLALGGGPDRAEGRVIIELASDDDAERRLVPGLGFCAVEKVCSLVGFSIVSDGLGVTGRDLVVLMVCSVVRIGTVSCQMLGQ